MTDLLPDTEGGCRTWLRSLATVTTHVAQRVFFAVPDDADETDYPLITVSRVGGGPDTSDAPIDAAVLQLKVHGTRRGKTVARTIAGVLWSEFRGIEGPLTWSSGIQCHGAAVESMIYMEDPVDSRPSYTLTVSAQVSSV